MNRGTTAAVDLAREKDIERLRQAALLLETENRRLVGKVMELSRALSTAQGEDARLLQLRIQELEDQLARRNHLLFGPSSKKAPTSNSAAKERGPRRGHGPSAQPKLSVVENVLSLEEADRVCNSCGGQLREWEGQFEESEEVHVLARKFVLVKHLRKKYRCSCGGCIDVALPPPKLFEGARYSVDFAIEVAIQKYLDHLPLERQVRVMKREGLDVTSQTLWDYVEHLVGLVEPGHARLGEFQLIQPVLGADETGWLLMGAPSGERTRWHVWALTSPKAAFYKILESRSAEAAREVLGDYGGIVVADGYSAYEALVKRGGRFTLAHCWSHVRRELLAASEKYPQALEAVQLIGKLYEVERGCPTGPPGDEQRRVQRGQSSREIVGKLQAWALEQRVLPESALGKAIAYMGGLWHGLLRFLEDPRIPLDNNATERALRGPVVGRKNHYGSRSRRGTEVAAVIYSLVESAKLNDIDPREYLRTAVHAALAGKQIPLPHELLGAA